MFRMLWTVGFLSGFWLGVGAVTPVDVKFKALGDSFSGASTPAEIPARLLLPAGQQLPAVVLLHGSAGPDTRGVYHRNYLAAEGFVVLELDMWAPRGITAMNRRPRSTLDTLPDVWGAWAFLAQHPQVDPKRIAVMGFSWGGVNAMATAFGQKPKSPPDSIKDAQFAAHVAFYPVCDVWVRNGIASRSLDLSNPTGAPVQIHNGLRDDYDTSPLICETLKVDHPKLPLEVFLYEGAAHGFDSALTRPVEAFDPVAKAGRGGRVVLLGNDSARELSKARVLDFLRRVLKKS